MEMLSFTGLLVGAALVAVGYVLRKYVEKKWPDESALLDAVAKRYGKEAETKLRLMRDKL